MPTACAELETSACSPSLLEHSTEVNTTWEVYMAVTGITYTASATVTLKVEELLHLQQCQILGQLQCSSEN